MYLHEPDHCVVRSTCNANKSSCTQNIQDVRFKRLFYSESNLVLEHFYRSNATIIFIIKNTLYTHVSERKRFSSKYLMFFSSNLVRLLKQTTVSVFFLFFESSSSFFFLSLPLVKGHLTQSELVLLFILSGYMSNYFKIEWLFNKIQNSVNCE